MAPAEKAAGKRPVEVTLTRLVDAPRELAFRAWTDPRHLARWWGPNGFTNPVCEVDARPGGTMRILMRGPDGSEHPMTATFLEVVEPSRLVFSSVALDLDGKALLEAETTVTFTAQGDGTKVTVTATAVPLTDLGARAIGGMEQGWTESLERLADDTTGCTMALTRRFDAPRELVFDAWTDPAHVSNWWGPRGFTTTTSAMAVQPGGEWRFTMHGPDGVDYPNRIEYLEVVRPVRLVYLHGGEGPDDPVHFHVTVTLIERDGKTELTMRALFSTPGERTRVAEEFGAIEGLYHTLGRLEEQLAQSSPAPSEAFALGLPSDREVRITRVFDAPRHLIFDMITNPEHRRHWWGPRSFEMVDCEMDVRPGGGYRFVLKDPTGTEYGFRGEYREIVPGERVVSTFEFEGMPGHVSLESLTLEERNGRTVLRVVSLYQSVEDRDGHLGSGMESGARESYDRLAEFLSQRVSS